MNKNRQLSVFQYNVLAQCFATSVRHTRAGEEVLKHPNRLNKVLENILKDDPDIICLQEVEKVGDAHIFQNDLLKKGYTSLFSYGKDKLYGCVIAWKDEVLSVQKMKAFALRNKDTQTGMMAKLSYMGNPIYVACTHLKADKTPKGEMIRQGQFIYLKEQMDKFSEPGENWIFCCDLNASPEKGVSGEPLAYNSVCEAGFISAYKDFLGKEPEYTTHKYRKNWKTKEEVLQSHCIDYIFTKGDSIFCSDVVDLYQVNKKKDETLPNKLQPSDHLPLMAYFSFLKC